MPTRAFLSMLLFFAGATAASAQCTLNQTNPSFTICTPTNGATVTSPVHVVAGTTSSSTVTATKIYPAGVTVYSGAGSSISTQMNASTGTHKLTLKSWNKASQVFRQSQSFTVSSGGTPPPQDLTATKHLIFMLQENRAFGNYFGK